MSNLYDILNQLSINYEKIDHPAVFTVAESENLVLHPGTHCKALFIRDDKKTQYFLVLMEGSKRIDFKLLQQELDIKKMTFASAEELWDKLQIKPGSVSPFCLINSTDKTIGVIIDTFLLSQEKLGFHPNDNTATLLVSPSDLKKFIEYTGYSVQVLNL